MTKTPIREHMTPAPHTIGAHQSLRQAATLMHEHGFRHIPVLEGGQLLGVVSERDVRMVQALPGIDTSQVTVSDAVPQEAYVVSPDADLEEVVRHMADHKYGSTVVMEGRRVVGIFTTIDALRVLADRIRS
jgi:acetoin utilization protein AcuB